MQTLHGSEDGLRLSRVDILSCLTRWVGEQIIGPNRSVPVPERVRLAITEVQQQSEVLVGWIQVCAIATFASLYALSAKAFPPDVPFQPVPVALAAYTLFVGLRLWLAYRRRLTAWILTISVIIDIAVLMITIWSFHLQYQTSPGIYLKAPTLLYVFILIALRALRFEPCYILLAGATAAIGWLVLVAYAVVAGNGVELTRNYVEYMTSLKLLAGAEFDKIISILMVTAILSIAVLRARNLLTRMSIEKVAAADISRFLSRDVVEKIRNADHQVAIGQGETRNAAAMFLDLRGFTAFSQDLQPCQVIKLLTDYQARIVPIIERHGGSVDKFLGDGIFASFGATTPSETYAADALRATDEILNESQVWAAQRQANGLTPLAVGASVAIGPVVFGAIGFGDRLEYTVLGDTVNLAAKLEKHTKAEGVRALTTVDGYALARAQGYRSAAPKARLKDRRVDGVDDALDLSILG